MADYLAETPLPESAAGLTAVLETTFHHLTGYPLDHPDVIHLPRYAHGGMSSGMIAPEFWRERGFPLLRERFAAICNGTAGR